MIKEIKKFIEQNLKVILYYDQPKKTAEEYCLIQPANYTLKKFTKDNMIMGTYQFRLIISVINKNNYDKIEELIEFYSDFLVNNNYELTNTEYIKTDNSNNCILTFSVNRGYVL